MAATRLRSACPGRSSAPLASQLLLLLSLAGCAEAEQWVRLADDGFLTFILAVQTAPNASWEVTVGTMVDRPVVRVPVEGDALLLLYAETREALGLTEGNTPRCRVLSPDRMLRLVENDATRGVVVETLPEALVSTLVGDTVRCDPCAPLVADWTIQEKLGRFGGAAWFDETSAIVVGIDGFYRASRERVEALPSCEGLTEPPYSIAAAGPNRYWVGGGAQELALVRFASDASTCVVETSTTVPAWPDESRLSLFQVLAPRPDDPAAHDVYAVRATGEVFHWTASGLRRLGRMDDHPSSAQHLSTTALRLEADRVFTSSGWNKVYVWYQGAAERVEEVRLPDEFIATRPRDRITTLGFDPFRRRLVLGAGDGSIWARDTDQPVWTHWFSSPFEDEVGSIIPRRDRFVVLQKGGDVGYHHHELGTCGKSGRIPQAQRSSPSRAFITRGSEVLVADALGAADREGGVAWIDEAAPEP